ncbi:MAG: protein kinase, partial [Deltaproteobacteria bacterium]|nr:protein kinase [Deltaproteobacteria bacterium]
MTLAPGTLVGGRFRVERLAGAGGMGEVHRAIDLESARPVAIKITRQTVDEEARFLRETRLLETLSDPAIVGYLGHGRLEDGRPYLAMEWLEGESLSDRLERGTLAPHEVTHVVRAVARALGVAHRRGIVHRDIKPSNVFLVGQAVGQGAIDGADVRLIDFGIARHHALRGATVTKTDAAIGTPHYMAPEQVRGSKSVGPAADVFALGCLLYECLVGRSPFVSETMLAALAAVLLEEPEPPRKLVPAISPELERLVLRMLSKDASQRPPDGDAVVRELDALGGGARDQSVALGALTFAGLSHREQRLVLVLVALPSEERRATDATQRADEPDRTTVELRGIVERSDGRVELSAEGALVASFSDEGATRDRVARARRCARRLLDADATVRIGIVAGRTVAGRVPVGEAVERAIAIARGAGHGAGGGIGLDDDVAAFAEESEETRVTGGAPRPKLFGRDREVGAIVSSIDEALGEPIARAIVVEGDTGIGRTAVLEAVLSRVGREMDGATRVLDVRLDAGDHDAPLSVIVRLVRSAAHIEDGESIDVRRDKLASHVETLEIAEDRRAALLRDLGDLARVPIADAESVDPTQRDHVMRGDAFLRGDRERRAFHDWIAAVAVEPVLIAIDDAQHADPSSIELLAQALAALVARPLVALGMVRTAPDDTRASLSKVLEGSGDAHVETQRLAPLLPRAAKSLVEQALPGADAADARAAIVSAGEGNPFFLRELCAAHLRGAAAPTSILAAIEERILRVSEEARRVLRAISLLREPSAPEAIAALVPGLSLPDVGARLDELARSELVEHDVRARVLYRPKSALVADAAYAMIPDDDRRVAHRLAGLGLRDAGAEPSRVGHHLERGGEPILAATSFRDAAERAIEAHDLVVARSHASRGLALVSSAVDDTRALAGDLFLRRAEASRWKGEYAAALEDALAALDALEPAGSRERERALRFLEALGIALVASSALGRDPAHEDAQARTWMRAELVVFADPLAFEDDREVVALAVVALCRGAAAWLGRGRREDAARWLARARSRAG